MHIISGATLTIASIGLLGAALIVGNRLGYKAGLQDAQIAIVKAINAADYPTVYLTYPNRFPVEMIRDGICEPDPAPAIIPRLYYHVWVSPQYIPCASQHYRKPTAMSPALQAMIESVQQG